MSLLGQVERAGVRIKARRAKTRPVLGLGSREPTRRARKNWNLRTLSLAAFRRDAEAASPGQSLALVWL